MKNWVLKTEVNGSTSDDKIARLPLMTRSLILGLEHGEPCLLKAKIFRFSDALLDLLYLL